MRNELGARFYKLAILDSQKANTLAMVSIVVLYTIYFLIAGSLKAENFILGRRDTALYETALWQSAHFTNPLSYVAPGSVSLQFSGGHFMPIGFLYGLLYRIFSSIETTVAIYSISFAIAGIFLYLLARYLTGNSLIALGLLIVYLAVYTPGLDHFYFEDWAAPYIAASLYLVAAKKYRLATYVWLFAMMFKEYIGLAVAAFGFACLVQIAVGLVREKRLTLRAIWSDSQARYGLIWMGMGSAWFLVAFFVIMHWFQPQWIDLGMFEELGNSEVAVAQSVLSQPTLIFSRVFSPMGLEYLGGLFLPLALVPLIGWESSFPMIPILLINFLPGSGHAIENGVNGHYTTMIQPFLISGVALGVVRLRGILKVCSHLLQISFIVLVVVWVGFYTVQGLKYHLYKLHEALVASYILAEHTTDVRTIFADIPADASIATDESLMPFLSNRYVLAHLENVSMVRPQYLLRDSYYDQALVFDLDRGMRMGLSLLQLSPKDFYNSAQWQQRNVPECKCPEYDIVRRRGSLILYQRVR